MAATFSCSRARRCASSGRNYLANADQARDPILPGAGGSARLAAGVSGISECDAGRAESRLCSCPRAAGVETEAVVYPGATHSFLEAVSIARVAERALQEGSAWLQSKLSS